MNTRQKPLFIGLAGAAGSGKDSVRNVLELQHEFGGFGFAEATEQQKRWSSGAPRLIAPTNGPGYTPRKWAEGNVVHGTATPKQPTTDCTKADYPKYMGEELQPNPGLTADRFAAFDLPSVVNSVSVPPKRITAMCVGAAGSVEAFSGTQRRFSA